MHECYIEHEGLLEGKYTQMYRNPFSSYFEQRNATVYSNVFFDEGYDFGDDVFENLVGVIRIARRKEFERAVIKISKSLISPAYLNFCSVLMAYERVIITTTEKDEDIHLEVNIPENIWLAAAYGSAKRRTRLHSAYMDDTELQYVREACTLAPRTKDQIVNLEKALEIHSEK